MKKFTDAEREMYCTNPLRCYDCGFRYGGLGWCDVIVPNDVWELINPTYHEGAGILCFNCISTRLDVLGMTNVKVMVVSGPFLPQD